MHGGLVDMDKSLDSKIEGFLCCSRGSQVKTRVTGRSVLVCQCSASVGCVDLRCMGCMRYKPLDCKIEGFACCSRGSQVKTRVTGRSVHGG